MLKKKYILTSFIIFFILTLTFIYNANDTKTFNVNRQKVYDGNTYPVYVDFYDDNNNLVETKFVKNVGESVYMTMSNMPYDYTKYVDLSNKISYHYSSDNVTTNNYKLRYFLNYCFSAFEEVSSNEYYSFKIVDDNNVERYYYSYSKCGNYGTFPISEFFDPRVYGADYIPPSGTSVKYRARYLFDYVEASFPSTPSKDGYYFTGWFNDLNQRVNYLNKYNDVYSYNSYIIRNIDRNLYAEYRSNDEMICKRGTKLHTETCDRDSGGCYDSGYYDEGSQGTTTITYGQKGISGELHSGDIFTCDVNNDGIYDEDTERFYYVSDYYNTETGSFENDKAVLIYNSNTNLEGPTNSSNDLYYYTKKGYNSAVYPYNQFLYCAGEYEYHKCDNYSDYQYVMSGFPYRWKTYLIDYTRTMRDGYDSELNRYYSQKSYEKNSSNARLLTVQEIKNACGISIGNYSAVNGNFDSCNFLFENTSYADSNITATAYWLENPSDSSGDKAWSVDANLATIKRIDSTLQSGSRPVIEMYKTNMEINYNTIEHDVTVDNNTPITVTHDTEYILPSVPARSDENVDITLNYTLDNIVTQTAYTRQYVANGWLVNGSGYNDEIMEAGDTIVVSDDVTLTPRYITVTIDNNFIFPSVAEISEYTATNVTFKYQDNETEDKIDNIKVSATATRWRSKKAIYETGDTYDGNISMSFYPDYVYPGGALENPTRDGYVFVGWYDAATNGNKITKNNLKSNMTLYAHWEVLETGKKCVRPSDKINDYLFDIYQVDESEWTYYGNPGTSGELNSGDILFCDVDGNGNYRGTGRTGGYHEEFYYVSDYYDTELKEFDSDTATLIGENEWSPITGTYGEKYNSSHSVRKPDKALYSLINSNEWNKLTNISLKNTNRQLLSNNNTNIVKDSQNVSYELEMIDYTGTNLRLLTYQELAEACEIIDPYSQTFSDDYNANVSLKHCKYLDQTFWLETQNADISESALRVQEQHIDSQSNASSAIIRPTIDVDKDDIQMYFNDYEHTITTKNQNDEVIDELGVQHGSLYKLGVNDYTYDDDGESSVTYVFQDGEREDQVRIYNRHHYNNGWNVTGKTTTSYSNNSTIYIFDDTVIEPRISYSSSTFNMPEPYKSGYRFDGWYTEPEGGELIDSVEDLVDRTLYAHWTMVYDLHNYDGDYSQVEPGTVITLPEDDNGYNNFENYFNYYFDFNYDDAPEPEDWTVVNYGEFTGWSINGGDYEPGDEYTVISDTYINAVYKGIVDEDSIPEIPDRDGYTFVGWYTEPDGGDLVDLANMQDYIYWNNYDYNSDSFNLYAHWIEYDSDSQVIVNWDGEIQIYDKGTTIDLDVPDKRGYEEVLYNLTFSTNKQTYPEYYLNVVKKYTRDYYLLDGAEHIDTGEYTFNDDTIIETVYTSEIIYPDVPIIESPNFLGWYEDNIDIPVTSVVGVGSSLRYSAKWKKVKVYVDGELRNGEIDVGLNDLPYVNGISSSYVKFVYNQYVNYIPSTDVLWVYPYYDFDYFTVEGDDSVKYYNNELYDYEEDTYFITHYKFTGEYSGHSTFNELMNNNFDLGRTTDWGNGGTIYYLEGWYDYLGDGGVKVDLRSDPSYLIDHGKYSWSPLTLYAKWVPLIENVNVTINDDEPYIQEFGEHQLIPSEKQVSTTKASDTFNITFDYNDGSNNRIVTQATRNYTFECFMVDGAGCYQRDDNYTFYQDTEIKNKYTTTYTYPEMDIPEVDDPMFKGWFTKESGGMEITDVSQLEEFTDDTIIYAQYYSGTVHLNFDGVETYVPQGTIITFEDKDPFDESITLTLDYKQDGLENKTLHYITTYTVDYYQVDPINESFTAYPGDVYVMEKDTSITTNYNSSLRHDFVGYSENDWDYGMIYYDSDGLANQLEGWQTMVCGSEGGGEIGMSTRESFNQLYGRDPSGGKDDDNCWYSYVDLEYLDFNQVEDGATLTASWTRPEAQVYYYDPIDDTNVDSMWYTVGDYIDYLPEYYTKDGYYFDGWYTDDTYTERVDYDYVIKVSNLTLYGHWVEDTREDPEKSLIIKPDETTLEVEKGTIYDLGTNEITKADDDIAEVYFVTEYYGEEAPPVYTTDYVKKRYTPNGWLVNGNYYSNLESIDCQDDIIVIRPYYDIELISPDFSEPTKDNYTFAGWYDHPETGIQYTEYIGSEDMPLFARWVGAEISVTKPDNTVEIYHYGDEYDLGTNEIEKADENVASVTFKYNDGREDTVSYVTKSFTPDKWKVNNVEEENDTVLTLTEDIVIEATYTESINELVFDEPTREHYSFDGWYDENDTELTSYNGTNDITVYAHWIGDEVTVTKPNLEVETYHYGDTYELGENEIEKASVNLGSVTFKYQDDVTADTTEYVKRKYTPSGWLVNNEEKANNQVLVLTEDIVIIPNYTDEIEAVEFVDATRENYTFDGWYDQSENGNRLTSYNGLDDIEVFAYWTLSKPSDFDVDSDNLLLLVGDIHQIEVTFTPDGTEDTLIYSGYDNEIISVTNEGLITALTPGETEITIALESDNSITKTISVKVVHDQITSTSLDVETRDLARIIIGEEPKTTLEDFLSKLENDIEYLSVYTEDNELIEDMETYAATGMKVKLTVGGVVQDEAVIIIRGDIDGDGLVNITDAGIMKRHIIEAQSIEGFRLYAADLDEDPEATPANMITVADSGILKRYIIEAIDSLNKKEGD